MSAFAVFFLQSPSWLSCQRAMQGEKGGNNARTLFGIGAVPTDNPVNTNPALCRPQALTPPRNTTVRSAHSRAPEAWEHDAARVLLP